MSQQLQIFARARIRSTGHFYCCFEPGPRGAWELRIFQRRRGRRSGGEVTTTLEQFRRLLAWAEQEAGRP